LNEDEFELREKSSVSSTSPSISIEAQFGFNLSKSLAIAKSRAQPLFDGYCIHVTKNVLPPPEQMYQIIECGGGKRVVKLPKANNLKGVVVFISTNEDEKLCTGAIKVCVVCQNNKGFLVLH